MHTFFIEEGGRLSKDEYKHANKVLRLSDGDEICVTDGCGLRAKAILRGDTAEITETLPDNESRVRVTLYMGLPKSDKLDLIAQKITELGAARVVPVKMERCVVKSDDRDAEKRRERLERIVREAVKQCGRGRVPEVLPAMTWKQVLADMAKNSLNIVPWEEARGLRMRDVYKERPDAGSVGIVIGPEGGMSADEVEALKAAGVIPVTLGARILRCETAAIASVAEAMTLWGDL